MGCAAMDSVTIFSPAKINLSLAITGRRADGFHELVSVAAQLGFGDTLRAERTTDGAEPVLACDAQDVPTDGTNLVMRAAAKFAETTGWRGGVRFTLEKRIPVGAGLGGELGCSFAQEGGEGPLLVAMADVDDGARAEGVLKLGPSTLRLRVAA